MTRSQPKTSIRHRFSHLARLVTLGAGTWQAFAIAALLIVVWLLGGLWIGYSDQNYQLFINTVTTIITFLMVFLIQHAQNHDTMALHAKLDEIIRAIDPASNELIAVEEMPEDVIAMTRTKVRSSDHVEESEAPGGQATVLTEATVVTASAPQPV